MRGDYWMNSDALLDRLNFALQPSNKQVRGMKFESTKLFSPGVLTDMQSAAPDRGNRAVNMRGADRGMSLLEWTLL